jgi:hypothetical protein
LVSIGFPYWSSNIMLLSLLRLHEQEENHGPTEDESGHRIADEASKQEEPASPKKQMAGRGRGKGSQDRGYQQSNPARHH